jgi:hypothetical protein
VAPEAVPLAAPSVAATSSVRQGFVLGWKRRRTVRRQELVLRAGAPSSGGGQAMPDGPAAAVPPAAAGSPDPGSSGSVPAAADRGPRKATTTATSDDHTRTAGPAGDKLPAQTFSVPSDPSAGGSMGWLLVLLLTTVVAVLVASFRRVLATTMTRI